MVQPLITNEMAFLMVSLVTIALAIYFDLIPIGGRKPLRYRPSGVPQRVNLFDGKNIPILEAVEDRNRGIVIAKTSKLKHRLFIPKDMVDAPSSMGAYLGGDTRRNVINLPMDCAGRYVPWCGNGTSKMREEQRVLDLQRQNYLLSERMQKIQEPIDNQVDNVFSRMREGADIIGIMNASAREATEQKRRS